MATPAWIGLGSNLGDRRGTLDAALAALAETSGVVVEAVSSYHETGPVGGPAGQGAFLNAAARLRTTLAPTELLRAMQGVEERLGRVREVRWGERTIDLDILIYGDRVHRMPWLILPHPRMAVRRFVLAPLAEIDPTLVEPTTGRTVAALLAWLDRKPRLLAIDGTPGAIKTSIFRRLVEELPAFAIEGGETDPDGPGSVIRRAEALRASDWAGETLRVPWIAADYCPSLDIRRLPRDERPAYLAASVTYYHEFAEAMRAIRRALKPTLVVSLSSEIEHIRLVRLLKSPTIEPESDEPDAIVAEVLATCRGIEGG